VASATGPTVQAPEMRSQTSACTSSALV
jgi:hypothetical protein